MWLNGGYLNYQLIHWIHLQANILSLFCASLKHPLMWNRDIPWYLARFRNIIASGFHNVTVIWINCTTNLNIWHPQRLTKWEKSRQYQSRCFKIHCRRKLLHVRKILIISRHLFVLSFMDIAITVKETLLKPSDPITIALQMIGFP